MTAEIIILPVVRIERSDKSAPVKPRKVRLRIELPEIIHEKLVAQAAKSDGNVRATAEALLIYALACAEQKTVQDFTASLEASIGK